jgi:L-ascorbate metabolism protein UlaG (beta-lactamase superfamily)
MRLTHFDHACVLLETDRGRVLFDPGTFSSGFESLTDLDAVVITHQHPDHIDVERLPALLAGNPGAELLVDAGTASVAAEHGLDATTVSVGDRREVAGVSLQVVGGDHAVIHPDIPGIPNVGYVVDDGAFYHPGDSFVVPDGDIDVLGLPAGAPWLKVSEAVDFYRAVSPRVAVPIHQAVLAKPTMQYGMFDQLGPSGSSLTVLPTAEPTQV